VEGLTSAATALKQSSDFVSRGFKGLEGVTIQVDIAGEEAAIPQPGRTSYPD